MIKLSWRVLRFCKPYTRQILLMLICLIGFVVFNLASFAALVPFLDTIFDTTGSKASTQVIDGSIKGYVYGKIQAYMQANGRMYTLYTLCVVLFVVFLLKNVFAYLVVYFLAIIEGGVVRDLRFALFSHLTHLPLAYFTNERKGELIVRMTSDLELIQSSVVGSFKGLIRHPLVAMSLLGAMFFISWKLTLFVLLILPLSGYAISRVSKSLKRNATEGQTRLSSLLSIVDEVISGMRVVKAFTAEKQEEQKFHQENNRYFNVFKKIYRRRELAQPLTEVLSVLIIIAVLLYGGSLIIKGSNDITASLFLTYIGIFSQLLPPIKGIGVAFSDMARGTASTERIFALLDTPPQVQSTSTPQAFPKTFSQIQYHQVQFNYGEKTVLKNINLTIRKGETVALVGSSGGGKSTLADLLPRFHEVAQGQIKIDEVDIKTIHVQELRQHLGIVTQQPILFNDTVLNNIRYGCPDASLEAVIQAAKIANAHTFITELEQGYESNLGERGSKLSGGQQQRICIARAVLQNPDILILDEATSALDNESEKLVQEALFALMKDRTSLVIAHRLSTIKNADKIVVIDQGEIVQMGTHQELISQEGIYLKLVKMSEMNTP